MHPVHRPVRAPDPIVHRTVSTCRAQALARPAWSTSELSATMPVAPRVRLADGPSPATFYILLCLLVSVVVGLAAAVMRVEPTSVVAIHPEGGLLDR